MGKCVKTIVHIAMHTTNIGDGALVKGIQTTLPADTHTEIRFVDHCITDFLFPKLSSQLLFMLLAINARAGKRNFGAVWFN